MSRIGQLLQDLPAFIPGLAASVVVAVVVAKALARRLKTHHLVAFTMVVGLGIVTSATLLPSKEALAGLGGDPGLTCDLARMRPASPGLLMSANEVSLNIFLFVPLAATVALLPATRSRAALLGGVALLPFAIEATQMLLPALGRECQSADVIDNLIGIALGWLAGVAVRSRYSLRLKLDRSG
jgi:glycopeptide antibiotics resistance protein